MEIKPDMLCRVIPHSPELSYPELMQYHGTLVRVVRGYFERGLAGEYWVVVADVDGHRFACLEHALEPLPPVRLPAIERAELVE